MVTSEMTWNKKRLGRWIEELRKEGLVQVKSKLCKSVPGPKQRGYCCLGIAAKLSRQGKFSQMPASDVFRFTDDKEDFYGPNSTEGMLTPGVIRWLGSNSDDPFIDYGERYDGRLISDKAGYLGVSCTEMNDIYGFTFPQIADMLEYFIYNNLSDEETR